MGTMNLLQGGIKGSVGAHTGLRKHGKNVFKGRIWSKTPPSNLQKNNVRSFEALNRISSAISKEFWQWMGLKQGNMNKHNAIASFFKPIIKDHVFFPPNLQTIIPLSNKIEIIDYSIDATTGEMHIEINANLPGININTQSVIVCCFNSKGYVVYCKKMTTPLLALTFKTQITLDFPYYIIVFSSTKTEKGYTLSDLNFKMTLPENVFYTEPYTSIHWWTVEPDKLFGEGGDLSSTVDTLVITT